MAELDGEIMEAIRVLADYIYGPESEHFRDHIGGQGMSQEELEEEALRRGAMGRRHIFSTVVKVRRWLEGSQSWNP